MNGEPKPKADAEPKRANPKARKLRQLHQLIGQLIMLESASQSPRIVIDGDIEVAWPDNVKAQVTARIDTKYAKVAAILQELRNGPNMD